MKKFQLIIERIFLWCLILLVYVNNKLSVVTAIGNTGYTAIFIVLALVVASLVVVFLKVVIEMIILCIEKRRK